MTSGTKTLVGLFVMVMSLFVAGNWLLRHSATNRELAKDKAPQSVVIRGNIEDSAGNPIGGHQIAIKAHKRAEEFVHSNKSGEFSYPSPPADYWIIRFENKDGQDRQTIKWSTPNKLLKLKLR